jgi:WD40 repeat protein
LWDVEEERQIARLPGWPADRSFVGFSPDGRLLAAVAAQKGLRVWNLERLEEVATLTNSAAAPSCDLCFTTNDVAVAVGNLDGTVEVWDLLRKERIADWKAHKDAVSGVAFMPDGKWLVTVSQDNTARLWEVETHREVRSFGRALNAFYSAAVSPDGQRIAAGTFDGLIKVWNPRTGQELVTLKGVNDWVDPDLPGRWDIVNSLAFLPPGGDTLISGTSEEVRLWRAPSWHDIAAAEKTDGKTQ